MKNSKVLLVLFTILGIIALLGWIVIKFIVLPLTEKAEALVPIESERKLGEVMADNVLAEQVKLKDHPLVDSAVAVITKRLTQKLGHTDYDYHFTIIKSPQINAFTIPGGNIFIYSGLIEFSESPEEVAAVLAHEIGHAEHRHVVKKMAKEVGVSMLFSVITGGDASILTDITQTAVSTSFDRDQEKDADDFSFELMDKAGVDPKSLGNFFKRMDKESGGYDKHLEILMTHPHNESREKAALDYKTSPGFKPQPFQLDWKKVRESLKE